LRDLWPKMDSDNAEQIVRCLRMIIEALQGKESGENLQALLETELLDILHRLIKMVTTPIFRDGDEVCIEQDTAYHVATGRRVQLEHGHGDGQVVKLSGLTFSHHCELRVQPCEYLKIYTKNNYFHAMIYLGGS
jgi:hypothetical protein